MTYKLIENSSTALTIDRTAILKDIKETFLVSFLLPCEGSYVAVFKSESGIEYKEVIKDGACKVPHKLLKEPQIAGLTVCKVEGEQIVETWTCEPIIISKGLHGAIDNYRHVEGAMPYHEAMEKLAVLEAQNIELTRRLEDLEQSVNVLTEKRIIK